ncbi:hypothetical protein OKA04_13090 [Luteolibacter flavescens]|uniref:Peptidase C39-like domain-containing protein n=1 Tax=Luteolibacter flavescens TaxID=1859460 RepID=A0ABT3FQ12_9BACT|nr:hypothetical protein [Luteolibacter flavescens]MCW1885668.1 hypothetical protein [Luteolibacter flavescens]
MKRFLASLLLAGVSLETSSAVPNSILGPIAAAESPLNGQDLTEQLFATALWDGSGKLPGEWNGEGQIATATISHLRARPKLFGREVILLRSVKREGKLESLEATFVDAGSYFGYFDEELPEGLSRRETRKEVASRLAEKQAEFSKIYLEAHTDLRTAISAACGGTKPDEAKIGRTRGLKTPVEEWQKNGKHVRLLAANNRLLRVSIAAKESDQWLDPAVAALPEREQLAKLAASVARDADGTVRLPDLQPIPQGYRPYCGLNSLAMAARHFGLHLDEDWLAVAAGFQNTGRADGANLVKVYHSVASEAGLGLDRTTKLDPSAVARAISQGMPVIVWRRFSHERNQLHTRFMRQVARDESATLPNPADAAERASWPGDSAPLHASVVVGYNPERKEVLFLESWTGRDKPRRMRVEELAATTYLCFVFKP